MIQALVALISGLLFAFGLGLSGMTQPSKVFGFLDLFGNWDPTLIFVMVGAIGVHFIAYLAIKKRPSPILAPRWEIPKKTEITPALIIGGTLFGMGWGLGGYCPGPALVSFATFEYRTLVFLTSMLVGMFLFQVLDRKFKFKR
jgi:uncharacterized protein